MKRALLLSLLTWPLFAPLATAAAFHPGGPLPSLKTQARTIAKDAGYLGKGSKQTVRVGPLKALTGGVGSTGKVEIQVWAQGRPGTGSRLEIASVKAIIKQVREGQVLEKAGTWTKTRVMP